MPTTSGERGQNSTTTVMPKARGVEIRVTAVDKRYGERVVLSRFDLAVGVGEFVAIVGRSGCGKSTLLRILGGLEPADAGQAAFDGATRTTFSEDTRIMFQDPRLLPWRSVLANVALGLDRPARARAAEVLAHVGLAERADDWPAVLSGGQRQRVALARALVHEPRLLLLDEPLGALDALTRIEMQQLIERLWQRHGFTALLVTHDVQEAIALADRVVLIEHGGVALDERVALRRPRERGTAAFAEIEGRVLDRVMRARPEPEPEAAGPAHSYVPRTAQDPATAS